MWRLTQGHIEPYRQVPYSLFVSSNIYANQADFNYDTRYSGNKPIIQAEDHEIRSPGWASQLGIITNVAQCLTNVVGLVKAPLTAVASVVKTQPANYNVSSRYLTDHEEEYDRDPIIFPCHSLPRWTLRFGSAPHSFSVEPAYFAGLINWSIIPMLFLIFSTIMMLICQRKELYHIPDYRIKKRFKTKGLRQKLINLIANRKGMDPVEISAQMKQEYENNYGTSRYLLPILSALAICVAMGVLYGSFKIQTAAHDVRKDIKLLSLITDSLKNKATRVREKFNEATVKLQKTCISFLCYGLDRQLLVANSTLADYMDLFEEYTNWIVDDIMLNMAEQFIKVDRIRFPVTIAIVVMILIMNAILIYGILYSSTYEVIRLHGLFGFVAVVVLYVASAVYLAVLILLSDLCADPDKFLLSFTDANFFWQADLIMYFTHCKHEDNIFKVPEHMDFLKRFQSYIEPLVRALGSCLSTICPKIIPGCNALNVVQNLITDVNKDVDEILLDVRCHPIHPLYVDLMSNLCQKMVFGLFVSLIACFLGAILFTVISVMSAQLYLWLVRQEAQIKAELKLVESQEAKFKAAQYSEGVVQPSGSTSEQQDENSTASKTINMVDINQAGKEIPPTKLPPIISNFAEHTLLHTGRKGNRLVLSSKPVTGASSSSSSVWGQSKKGPIEKKATGQKSAKIFSSKSTKSIRSTPDLSNEAASKSRKSKKSSKLKTSSKSNKSEKATQINQPKSLSLDSPALSLRDKLLSARTKTISSQIKQEAPPTKQLKDASKRIISTRWKNLKMQPSKENDTGEG